MSDPRVGNDWRLDPKTAGLLVIDAQEKLLPAIRDSQALVKRIAEAVAVARVLGLPIFLTEQVPEKLGPTVAAVRAAFGGEAPAPRAKRDFSSAGSFAEGELPPVLLVAGAETHVCVRQSVYDFRARGHGVYLLADAVGSRTEIDHRLALHELRETGARVTTLETVAWELLRGAGDERFRRVLAILK
jgi:nicotinamidase-related amidase